MSKKYEDYLDEKLKDDDYAMGYLAAALEDEDPGVFLLALQDVIRAKKIPITKIANDTGLNRPSLYRALSKEGNPTIRNIDKILRQFGYRFSVEKADAV